MGGLSLSVVTRTPPGYAARVRAPAALSLAIASIAGLSGCPNECESVAPSFELDIRSMPGAGSIEVVVEVGGVERVRTFNLGDALDDGETSLVVVLEPPPAEDFDLNATVTAFSGTDLNGGVIAVARDTFSGTPDGCNLFKLDLRPPGPDAGMPDAGPQDQCRPGCGNDTTCHLSCDLTCFMCNLDCAGGTESCDPVCDNGHTCAIDCAGTDDCDVRCSTGSNCEISCTDSAVCKARCNGGASCKLDCQSAADCHFTLCAGGDATCADGSIVCNRACQ